MWKQALRKIGYRKIPFLAITVLIAMASTWYVLCNLHIADTVSSITAYDAEQNTEDYSFILRTTLSDEQWERIFQEYAVIEDAFNKYVTNTNNEHKYRIFPVSDGVINRPRVLEGRLPERADELTVSRQKPSALTETALICSLWTTGATIWTKVSNPALS